MSWKTCPVAVAALALLAACGGGSAPLPAASGDAGSGYIGTSAIAVTAKGSAQRPWPGYPALVPDTIPNSKYYEYIINDYSTYAGIFDYPNGHSLVGRIENVGGQGCTNRLYGYGNTTFWIVAGSNQISLYSAPDHLIRSLSDSIGAPSSCAMSTGGDLAVGILQSADGGDVIIYKGAQGSGTQYETPLVREYFDGYDAAGNLFADGFNSSYKFQIVELPKGGSAFVPVTTSNKISFPGSVQWDGTYLVVTDQGNDDMYRYSEDGTKLTLQGKLSLSGSNDCAQTWIAQAVVYCADAGNNDGYVFNYPAGGSPIARLTGKFALPLGTVAVEK